MKALYSDPLYLYSEDLTLNCMALFRHMRAHKGQSDVEYCSYGGCDKLMCVV